LDVSRNFLHEKAEEATKQKEENRGKLKPGEQECMPQHISTALLHSIAEMGTQSAMKSSRKSWITTGHARGTRKRFRNPENTLYVDICISKSICTFISSTVPHE
jgi:hypothetical protein